MAVAGAFSADATEQKMARVFVTTSLAAVGRPVEVFASPAACRAALEALTPSADHMFFFEYNFLYVLAAGGRPEKAALGDHSAAGYAQRARFYAVSPEARLRYAQGVAGYLVFLAEHTRPRLDGALQPGSDTAGRVRGLPVLRGRHRRPGVLTTPERQAWREVVEHRSTGSRQTIVR